MALTDRLLFSDFIRSIACWVEQVLNVCDIALDVGVSAGMAKRWLSLLEKSDVLFYLCPYFNNLLKRTITTPKLYFFDASLVAYLTRYSSPEIFANGAINGAILENYVLVEVLKSYHNNEKKLPVMILPGQGQLGGGHSDRNRRSTASSGIKRSVNPSAGLVGVSGMLDKPSVPRGTGAITPDAIFKTALLRIEKRPIRVNPLVWMERLVVQLKVLQYTLLQNFPPATNFDRKEANSRI